MDSESLRSGEPYRRDTTLSSCAAPKILLVGGSVAHFGSYEVRVQRGAATQDSVIDAADAVQRTIANSLDTIGPAITSALFAGFLATGVIIRRRRAAAARPRQTRRQRGTAVHTAALRSHRTGPVANRRPG
ncbi:hypothetical protein ACFYW6_13390 [Streptomyces sp. NPDC002659]|uniref:hypothetical protein n=1 Tax=Streptomyces sp. NPDC002659 TaxID=3364656 RepID=UPI00367DCACF